MGLLHMHIPYILQTLCVDYIVYRHMRTGHISMCTLFLDLEIGFESRPDSPCKTIQEINIINWYDTGQNRVGIK